MPLSQSPKALHKRVMFGCIQRQRLLCFQHFRLTVVDDTADVQSIDSSID
jgi:hypothetical protein